MSRARIKDDTYDRIITDRLVFSKTISAIAEENGLGETSVSNTLAVFNAVRDGDWNRCIALIENQRFPLAPFIWAARKIGIELPACVTDAYDNLSKQRARQKAEEAEKTETIKTAPVIAEKNDALYFIKILEALNKQNELLTQLLDTVIPHWVNDLKDNVNANGDAILERINEEIKISECIKQNTRKRGL